MTAVDHRRYDYETYSQLTGPFHKAPESGYTVRYVSLLGRDRMWIRSFLLVVAAFAVELLFLMWLVWPSHWPTHQHGGQFALSMALVVSIGVIELFRLVNVGTLGYATLTARDPLPVRPERGTRVAFLTSIVPSREPVEMAEATLRAALRVRHDGPLDVWLLDEGDDPQVRAMCARLGVHHFTRYGIKKYNQAFGHHKAKTKHGNYNAWLDAHGADYDFWVSVDTDHVPLPNFAERLLGYFRDPDVAFVVGPQVYGNYDNFVTKAAESQQYLFHSVLQRAGNTHDCAMFVGTNNAMRISALRQVGGLADSITEDAATSMAIHAQTNPETGRRWKSVYTPDVLAVGEGPTSWTDYFTQQHRWSRGTNEVIMTTFWRTRGLGLRRRLHYALLMSYYPTAALAWLLGTANLAAYLLLGAGGVHVSTQLWLMLYVDAAILQLAVYFFNRRHNVSPHEEQGSSGVAGMFVSILSAPVYVTALLDGVRRRDGKFVITPKGHDASTDSAGTFAKNTLWGLSMAALLAGSQVLHHDHFAMRGWALMSVVISLLPVVIWKANQLAQRLRGRRQTYRATITALPATAPTSHPVSLSLPDHIQEMSR